MQLLFEGGDIQGQRLIAIYVLSIQPCRYCTLNLEKMSIFIKLTGSHHQDLPKARLVSIDPLSASAT